MSSFTLASEEDLKKKDKKKVKKEKKEKKDKDEKKDKKKKKKKKDLLAKLAALPDVDPNALSSDDETKKPAKKSEITRTAIEAEYIPEDTGGGSDHSGEDGGVPEFETEKERKKRIKNEKKQARRAKEAAKLALEEEQEEEEGNGDTTSGESKSSSKIKKGAKKLTKRQKKQLALEASMAEMDKALSTSKADARFPFTMSHCVQAIQDKASWDRSTDINIEEFTVAGSGAKGTQLFENASLKIVAGRKYGEFPKKKKKFDLFLLFHFSL